MQHIGRLYVRRFNHQYNRTGTLFEGRYRSCLVQDTQYLMTCMQYIEMNPIRTGLVNDPGDYKWSSYRCHAMGLDTSILSPHAIYHSLGNSPHERQKAYRNTMSEALGIEAISEIRHLREYRIGSGNGNFSSPGRGNEELLL